MDKGKIIPLVTRKHGLRLHPDDPLWAVVTMTEDIEKEALERLQQMLTEQLDQIAAANVQAEAAAVKRAEKLITEAGVWLEKRARDAFTAAADAAAAKFVAETQDAKKELRKTVWATWICAATAACAAIGSVAALWL